MKLVDRRLIGKGGILMSDLISRQDAIDAIGKKQGSVFEQDAEIDTASLYVYSECKAIIKDLPSVQPRRGKWIGYNADDKDWQRDDGSPVFMNCSECHGAVINNGSAHWNFCPNCGCRMEEGDSE